MRYLINWGLEISTEQFEDFYSFLDNDGDGHVTYEDFKKSVGSVISPVEFLYFRQDIPPQRIVTCQHQNWWEVTKGSGKYWSLHKKILKDKTLLLLSKFQKQMKQEKWSLFLEDLKKNWHENRTWIQIAKFFELLSLYNLAINQKEKDDLLECLGMKDEGNSVDLNIKLFFVDLKQLKDMHKIYKTINLEEREDEEEIKCIQNKLLPISEEQLLQIISEVKGFKDLHREFKKWDLDTNGYLTITELNQIFIQIYPKLEGRSLYKIFRPFSSIQNKSLVEYKKLTEYLKGRIEQLPQKAQPSKLKAIIDQNKELDLAQQNIELIEKNDKLENENNIDKIEIKPQTTKRMDNIRKEILKSFEEIPELGTFYPQETTQIPPDSDIKLKQRTRLEALLSPKVGQRSLPLLTAKNLQKTMGVQQNVTVLSPKQVMSSKISNWSAVSSPFFSKSNQILKHKLGYEWKNIMKYLLINIIIS